MANTTSLARKPGEVTFGSESIARVTADGSYQTIANRPLSRAASEWEADARLMTAASDLLAAAQQAFGDLDSLLDYVGESNAIRMIGANEAYRRARKTVDALHAAIAKATGSAS